MHFTVVAGFALFMFILALVIPGGGAVLGCVGALMLIGAALMALD